MQRRNLLIIILFFLSSLIYSQDILSSPPRQKEQETPDTEEERRRRMEVEVGLPFTFRVLDENSVEYESSEDMSNSNNEYTEIYYFGFKSVRPVDTEGRWTLGMSLSAAKSPTENLGLPENLDGRELDYLEFVITGAALTFYLKNLHQGPYFTLSGGTAIIDIGKGDSYDEEMSTRFFGPGIEFSGGYAYNVSSNYSLVMATKVTYCGAYIDIISEYWGFFNVSFYIGFSF